MKDVLVIAFACAATVWLAFDLLKLWQAYLSDAHWLIAWPVLCVIVAGVPGVGWFLYLSMWDRN